MSQTLRIYAREYGTGVVHLIGGWGMVSGSYVKHLLRKEADDWAKDIGATVQEDREGGLHVLKTEGHRAVGRYYFIADSPLQVPLGDGWRVIEDAEGDPEGDLVFGFGKVRLTWKALSQDEIDAQHGNDEFGGWWEPVIDLGDGLDPIYLGREAGSTDAVRLMMMDAFQVVAAAKALD